MKTKIIGIIVLSALILLGWRSCQNRKATAAQGTASGGEKAQIMPVTVTNAQIRDIPIDLQTFGAVDANQSVAIKSQITGVISETRIKEGQDVQTGDVLFVIDPRPLQAALQQAESLLAKDSAQLENARKELNRQESLQKKGFSSDDAVDTARTTVKMLTAAVQADQAAVDNARVQLGYCTIKSPINGRTSEILLDAGNLVKANDVTLLTINQITPIQVRFTVPQQSLPDIRKSMAAGEVTLRAQVPGRVDQTESGTVTFVNNTVDAQTGTVLMKALFPNQQKALWPGQFVSVAMTLGTDRQVVTIPNRAIQTSQQGNFVFVVKPDETVEYRLIDVARTAGDMAVIRDHLKSGEAVVTDGQLRLTPGSKVAVK